MQLVRQVTLGMDFNDELEEEAEEATMKRPGMKRNSLNSNLNLIELSKCKLLTTSNFSKPKSTHSDKSPAIHSMLSIFSFYFLTRNHPSNILRQLLIFWARNSKRIYVLLFIHSGY